MILGSPGRALKENERCYCSPMTIGHAYGGQGGGAHFEPRICINIRLKFASNKVSSCVDNGQRMFLRLQLVENMLQKPCEPQMCGQMNHPGAYQ